MPPEKTGVKKLELAVKVVVLVDVLLNAGLPRQAISEVVRVVVPIPRMDPLGLLIEPSNAVTVPVPVSVIVEWQPSVVVVSPRTACAIVPEATNVPLACKTNRRFEYSSPPQMRNW